jgi:hypothetical protein
MTLNATDRRIDPEPIQPSHMKTPKEYQLCRDNLWPSLSSLQWFIRRNYECLVQRSALVKLNGRKLIVTPLFDAAACEIGCEAIQNDLRGRQRPLTALPMDTQPIPDSGPRVAPRRVRRPLPADWPTTGPRGSDE